MTTPPTARSRRRGRRPTRPGSAPSTWPACPTSAFRPTARRTSCAGTRSRRAAASWNGAAWAATSSRARARGTQTASDLGHFGSRGWVRGLLENPASPTYFGKVAKFDGMAEWKKSSKLSRQGTRRRGRLRRVVRRDPRRHDARRLAQQRRASPTTRASRRFRKSAASATSSMGFTEGGLRDAPELFGWGSPQWIARMIRKPRSSDKYGFLDEKQDKPDAGVRARPDHSRATWTPWSATSRTTTRSPPPTQSAGVSRPRLSAHRHLNPRSRLDCARRCSSRRRDVHRPVHAR